MAQPLRSPARLHCSLLGRGAGPWNLFLQSAKLKLAARVDPPRTSGHYVIERRIPRGMRRESRQFSDARRLRSTKAASASELIWNQKTDGTQEPQES